MSSSARAHYRRQQRSFRRFEVPLTLLVMCGKPPTPPDVWAEFVEFWPDYLRALRAEFPTFDPMKDSTSFSLSAVEVVLVCRWCITGRIEEPHCCRFVVSHGDTESCPVCGTITDPLVLEQHGGFYRCGAFGESKCEVPECHNSVAVKYYGSDHFPG